MPSLPFHSFLGTGRAGILSLPPSRRITTHAAAAPRSSASILCTYINDSRRRFTRSVRVPGRNAAGSEQRHGDGRGEGQAEQRRAGGGGGGAGGDLLAAEVDHRAVRGLLHAGGLWVLAGVLPAAEKKKRTRAFTRLARGRYNKIHFSTVWQYKSS